MAAPYGFGAAGARPIDDTAAVQAAFDKINRRNASGAAFGTIDLEGGTYRISRPIHLPKAATPHEIRITNGALIPATGFTGNMLDLSAAATLTDLRLDNFVINGYGSAHDCLKLGAKTQGVWITNATLEGCTNAMFEDVTTTAATEIKMTDVVIQGAPRANVGTGIIVNGNDGRIEGGVIRNVAVGIRIRSNGAYTVDGVHIYSESVDVPIPDIWASYGSQIQIVDNYIDEGYLLIENPSQAQIVGNKFLYAGKAGTMTLPGGASVPFSPVVLKPTSAQYDLFDLILNSNNFINVAGPVLNPVTIDTAAGTIMQCQSTSMMGNGFSGYHKMATEPRGRASVTSSRTLTYNFNGKVPWCPLATIRNFNLESAPSGLTVTRIGVSGTSATLTTSAPYSGYFNIFPTVNADD